MLGTRLYTTKTRDQRTLVLAEIALVKFEAL